MNKSLGLVEVKGLALAIQTVDAMSKSANVEILGLEGTNGGGWTLIKVVGDVGSINAAVEIGRDIALKNDGLVSCKVIARTGNGLESLVTEQSAPTKATPTKAAPAKVAEPKLEGSATPTNASAKQVASKKPAAKKAPAKKGAK